MPAVSVLMCVYNGARYLSAAVDSVLRQTFADFEFVIIDDASTDNTLNILDRTARGDSRVKIYRRDVNDMIASLNYGLGIVSAPLLARMDADDVCWPDRLAAQVEYMGRIADVDVVGSYIRILGAREVWRAPSAHDDIVSLMPFQNPIFNPTAMIRREGNRGRSDLASAIIYHADRRFAEDYDIWVRLALGHGARFANIRRPLVDYRRHQSSLTAVNGDRTRDVARLIQRDQLARLGCGGSSEECEIHFGLAERRLRGGAVVLSRARTWLQGLENANDKISLYPRAGFSRRVGVVWSELCVRSMRGAGPAALRAYLGKGAGRRSTRAVILLPLRAGRFACRQLIGVAKGLSAAYRK